MINIRNIKYQYLFSRFNEKSYVILWASIVIYSIAYLTATSKHIEDKFCIIIMSLGLLGFAYSFSKLAKFNISNRYFRLVFILYMSWQIYIIIHTFPSLSSSVLIYYISSPYMFLHYFVPLLILIPANIFFINKIFSYFSFLAILLFIVFLLYTNEILFSNLNFSEETIWTLGTGGGFMMLTWRYHNKKRRIIAFLAVMLSLFISTIMARRNIMITFGNYFIFSMLIILFSSTQSIISKIYILIAVLFTTTIAYNIFLKYEDGLFSKITDRIDENTREDLIATFVSDMSSDDWIYGKGFSGEYYAPGIEENEDNRFFIESGYLQMILKGGIINLVLFLLIAFPSIYFGLVKSNNILCKASGSIVLLWLIDMFPWGMPSLNIRYILLWICIGICYSKILRSLSDNDIRNSLILLDK